MRSLLAVLVLAVSSVTIPDTGLSQTAPDLTPPGAPANLKAVLAATSGRQGFVTVTWNDTVTVADEFNTCVWGKNAAGAPVGGGCVYAVEYNAETATGTRTGTVILGADVATVTAVTNRRFLRETLPGVFRWQNVASKTAGPVPVEGAGGRGRR